MGPTAISAVRLSVVRHSVGSCVPSRSHTQLFLCESVCIFAVLLVEDCGEPLLCRNGCFNTLFKSI